jgi:thioredoxin reductase
MPESAILDVIIVGGGPAGLSAALMLGRCRRRVLVCDSGRPRNRRSRALHGYLTRDGIAPLEFNALGRRELARYGVAFRRTAVRSVRRSGRGFRALLANGRTFHSRFVLLASGVLDVLPPVSGLNACYGRSVFHCPYCDGWEWRDRRLAVLGSGAQGTGLALSIKTWSADVLLCTNGRRIPQAARRQLRRNDIAVRTEPIARFAHTRGQLTAIVFQSGEAVDRDATFFSSGQYQHCDLAVTLGCSFTPKGTVSTGTLSNTNVTGVFVAGDASRDAQFVIVAAAEGVKAAMAINQALQREELAA